MKSQWDDATAKNYRNDSLEMRVYSSRLIGQDEDLVLHGGGNTSIKLKEHTIFGEVVEGQDVVKKLEAAAGPPPNGKPTEPLYIRKATIEEKAK